jgi:hypothetical protein
MPIRIEEVVQRVSVYFIPVYNSIVGYQGKCDLCERVLVDGLLEHRVPFHEWKPSDGIPRLAEMMKLPPPPNARNSDVIIHSLLSAEADRTTLNSLDISFGLTTGCILGAVIGAAVGYFILPNYLRDLDMLGCIFMGILGGLVTGGILGASLAALVRRKSLPYEKFKTAIDHYALDSDMISRAADGFPMRIRNAARRARDTAALRLPKR